MDYASRKVNMKINFVELYIQKLLIASILIVLFYGCTTTKPVPTYHKYDYRTIAKPVPSRKNVYIVKRGDNIWTISKRLNVPKEEIIRLNNLKNPSLIRPGDILEIPPPKTKSLFLWPAEGKIVRYFAERKNSKLNKGIDIATEKETSVKAAADGYVTFSEYLKGYGVTVIIKHSANLSTVYANLKEAFVNEGDRVGRGQLIGKTGKDLRQGVYLLHFEIRDNYRPINPLIYLRG